MRLGILGAGRVGQALGRTAIAAGIDTAIATLRSAEEVAALLALDSPEVPATDLAGLRDADFVVLAIPMHRYRTLPVDALAGLTVIDAMNYWPPMDGRLAELEQAAGGTSTTVQAMLPTSTVVKTLGHIAYRELEEQGLPVGTPRRRALGVAGDDTAAVDAVAVLINDLGYDPVPMCSLAAGIVLEPGTDLFTRPHTRTGFLSLMERDLLALNPKGNRS